MYNTLESSKQRWGGYSEIIDYWLTLRQELLVSFSKVAGLNKSDKRSLPKDHELEQFFASLVDYVSAGHFRIYNKVMERWRAQGITATPQTDELYFKIVATTQPLVEFNDKYIESQLTESNFSNFDRDISVVAQIMEMRFELEDQLIGLIADTVKPTKTR